MKTNNWREEFNNLIDEFQDRSNDALFCENECKNSFWFTEDDLLCYDQDKAGKWLYSSIQSLLDKQKEEIIKVIENSEDVCCRCSFGECDCKTGIIRRDDIINKIKEI